LKGGFTHRKNLRMGLCKKSCVSHFGFHVLRHACTSQL
jgi:hypothetical protein